MDKLKKIAKECWFEFRLGLGYRIINLALDVLPDGQFKVELCCFLVEE
ncbi:MAG: hypothetical protein HRT61_24980 [Ekhidna sp.]|nr:hypothetical protein [Ekhidna sp.]